MAETCNFGKLLKIPCNKRDFCRTVRIKKLTELTKDEQEIFLWTSSLLGQNRELTMFPSWAGFWQYFWEKNHKILWSSELPLMQGERWKDHISSYSKTTQRRRVKCWVKQLLTQFVFMHRNFVLLVDAIDWDVNYQDLINKVACDSSNKECTPPRFLLGGASIFFFGGGGGGLVKRRVTFLQGELQFSHKN